MEGTSDIEHGSLDDLLKIFALNGAGLRSYPTQKALKLWRKRTRLWYPLNAAAVSRKHV